MESKLLVGGKNIIDHTNEQQKMLALKRQEIAEQVREQPSSRPENSNELKWFHVPHVLIYLEILSRILSSTTLKSIFQKDHLQTTTISCFFIFFIIFFFGGRGGGGRAPPGPSLRLP